MNELTNLQKEMESIEQKVIQMGGTVSKQFKQSVEHLVRKESNLSSSSIIEQDLVVDEFDEEIHEWVLQLITIIPPMPEELKYFTALIRVSRELERIGDHAVNIIKIAETSPIEYNKNIIHHVEEMKKRTLGMLDTAMGILQKKDHKQVIVIEEEDQVVDRLFHYLQTEIMNRMKVGPQQIEGLAPFFLVIRYLERSADHVVNIARQVKESNFGESNNELASS